MFCLNPNIRNLIEEDHEKIREVDMKMSSEEPFPQSLSATHSESARKSNNLSEEDIFSDPESKRKPK